MKRSIPYRLTVACIATILSSILSRHEAMAELGVEGRVIVRDFMPPACSLSEPCGPYPRVYPGGEAEVVAMTRSGRVISMSRATPNGNFFIRLRRGRYILSVPSLGIVKEVRVRRSLITGLQLAVEVR